MFKGSRSLHVMLIADKVSQCLASVMTLMIFAVVYSDMVAVASSHKLLNMDNSLLIAKGKREHVLYDVTTLPVKGTARISETRSTPEHTLLKASGFLKEQRGTHHLAVYCSPLKQRFCTRIKALSDKEKHLKSLDAYLGKLHNDSRQPFTKSLTQSEGSNSKRSQLKPEDGLRLVEEYLRKAKDAEAENYVSGNELLPRHTSAKKEERMTSLKNYMELKTQDVKGNQIPTDNISDFYLIGALASLNIAVFIFEIATPVKNSNFELFSLPLIYGAKINNLILTGEWWRLVTPMFLHSGIFHIAIGLWLLFTFGIQVCQEYGSFTFLFIYILGGISGNLISFLHTPEPTVGGTGPVFSLIGAWLIYRLQNKDVLDADASERMFQKAIIASVFSCLLANFCPIDDWSHFAATFTGIAYGYATCPTIQVKDVSSEAARPERMTLVRRYASPCRSLMYFSLFLVLLSSFLFVFEPPLDLVE